MKALLLCCLIFMTSGLFAAEIKMATITSNIDQDVARFFLITDDKGDIDSMRYTITKINGSISEDITHPVERVMQDGVILVERDGFSVLKLFVEKFSPKTGGIVKIDFLYSGVSGTRYYVPYKLTRNETGYDFTSLDNRPVNHLFIQGNWNVLLGLVGIRDISSSYRP